MTEVHIASKVNATAITAFKERLIILDGNNKTIKENEGNTLNSALR